MAKSRQKSIAIVVVAVVVIAWLCVGGAMLVQWWGDQQSGVDTSNSKQDGSLTITQKEADLTELVKKASPTVVSIVTTQVSGQGFFQQGAVFELISDFILKRCQVH